MRPLEKQNPGWRTGATRVNRQVVTENYNRFFLKNQVISCVLGEGVDA